MRWLRIKSDFDNWLQVVALDFLMNLHFLGVRLVDEVVFSPAFKRQLEAPFCG